MGVCCFNIDNGAVEPPGATEATYSTLGEVDGGQTVAAGTILPATEGEIILKPGAETWVRITGTAAKAGDSVWHVYQGRRVGVPTNPAARITSAAGPGAPGAVLADGVIELALNGSNTDLNYSHWFIRRKP